MNAEEFIRKIEKESLRPFTELQKKNIEYYFNEYKKKMENEK